jgi:uncharacterized membrane protein
LKRKIPIIIIIIIIIITTTTTITITITITTAAAITIIFIYYLFIPLSLRTEHRASTVPRHPRLLFQFLGSIRHLVGLLGTRPLPTQDNTIKKDAD